MSVTEILIKLFGAVLALVGLALLLSAVGINFLGLATPNIWVALILGFLFIAAGVYLVRGGTITV